MDYCVTHKYGPLCTANTCDADRSIASTTNKFNNSDAKLTASFEILVSWEIHLPLNRFSSVEASNDLNSMVILYIDALRWITKIDF